MLYGEKTLPTKATRKSERRKRRDPNETKKDSFLRLAETRLKAIQDKLRILSNLANTQHYEFESGDVDKLFIQIDKSVATARKEFESALKNKSAGPKKSR